MSVWKGEIRLKVCFERLSMLRDMAISLSFKRRLSTIKCAVCEHPCSDCYTTHRTWHSRRMLSMIWIYPSSWYVLRFHEGAHALAIAKVELAPSMLAGPPKLLFIFTSHAFSTISTQIHTGVWKLGGAALGYSVEEPAKQTFYFKDHWPVHGCLPEQRTLEKC